MIWYIVIGGTGTNIETDNDDVALTNKTLTLFFIATGLLSLLWNLFKNIRKSIKNTSSINVNQLGYKIPIEESSSCILYEI